MLISFGKLTVDELNSDTTIGRAYNVNDIKISPVAVSQVYTPADTTDDNGDFFSNISVSDLFNLVKIYAPEFSTENNEHGWLDKNGWESRKTYVLKDGVIYEAYLKIAKAKDGRNILYAVNLNINNGIAVDQGATQKRAAILSAMPSNYSIPNSSENVKPLAE